MIHVLRTGPNSPLGTLNLSQDPSMYRALNPKCCKTQVVTSGPVHFDVFSILRAVVVRGKSNTFYPFRPNSRLLSPDTDDRSSLPYTVYDPAGLEIVPNETILQ